MSSALLVVVAFGVQVAYGTPMRSTQTIRALSCCSNHCDHATSAAAAAHCCGVAGGGSDLAASPKTKPSDRGPATHATLFEFDVLSGLGGQSNSWVVVVPAARTRAAPLFLLTHSLRI